MVSMAVLTRVTQEESVTIDLSDPHFITDPVVFQLASLLAGVDDEGGPAGPTFVDGVSIALASRLFTLHSTRAGSLVSNKRTPLPQWRLKRAFNYIEANVTRPIYLAEVSNAAGLSRMHFATQFRAATGYSPSNYILRRKVARSQELLVDPQLSIADVAAMMGFSTQAHFTVVFKRLVGKSPARWRQSARERPLESNESQDKSSVLCDCMRAIDCTRPGLNSAPFDLNNPRSILKDECCSFLLE
jgi:AraC-like DNA-binding protein